MTPRAVHLSLAMLVGLVPGVAIAQDAPPRPAVVSWTAWGGMAHNSPSHIWGTESGRDIAVVAVRYARELHHSDGVAIEYAADLVPAAWVTMPRIDSVYAVACGKPDPSCREYRQAISEHMVRGIGLAPLGFQFRFAPRGRLQPWMALNGGFLRFGEQVPVHGASRLNFTAEGGAGVLLRLTRGASLIAGYKFYHISNGGTARQNPGIDGHMLVVGLRRG